MSLLSEIKDMIEHFVDRGHAPDLPKPIVAVAHRLAEAVDNLHPAAAAGAADLDTLKNSVMGDLRDHINTKLDPFLADLRAAIEGRFKDLEGTVATLQQELAAKPAPVDVGQAEAALAALAAGTAHPADQVAGATTSTAAPTASTPVATEAAPVA